MTTECVAELPSAFNPQSIYPEVKRLSQPDNGRSARAIVLDWAMIGACWWSLSAWSPPGWAQAFLVVVIAARQHALLILMHEAAHFRLFKSRWWNERISNWLMSYPCFITTDGYRQGHLAHHQHVNQPGDPDWEFRQTMDDWRFPKTRRELVSLVLGTVLGGGPLFILRGIRYYARLPRNQKAAQETWLDLERLSFCVIASGGVTYFGVWKEALFYWILPLYCLLPTLMRVRSISEHFGLQNTHELNRTRNYRCNPLERFFLVPHFAYYHLDHHLFPSVPFYNLPKLHLALEKVPGYAEMAHQNDSIFGWPGNSKKSVLSDLVRKEAAG